MTYEQSIEIVYRRRRHQTFNLLRRPRRAEIVLLAAARSQLREGKAAEAFGSLIALGNEIAGLQHT